MVAGRRAPAFAGRVARMAWLGCWIACAGAGLGCAGARGAGASAGSNPLAGGTLSGAPAVSLRDVAERPASLAGKAVEIRARLVRSGRSADGVWLELAALGGTQQGAGSVILLSEVALPGQALEEAAGHELLLVAEISGADSLADGRRAVRFRPLQMLAGAPAAEVQRTAPARFFDDPHLTPGRFQPRLRTTFLDPELARPRWHVPGPVSIEVSGPSDRRAYRIETSTRSENGATRRSVCRFRVEGGRLRSVGYDERVDLPGGAAGEERHLDFAAGRFLDKVTGRTFPWPPNIYADPCLGFALAGFPAERAEVVRFLLWSEYDPATPVAVSLERRERVRVPAGEFRTLVLRLGVSTRAAVERLALPSEQGSQLAREIAARLRPPDTFFWVAESAPHIVVRSRGPMGPPGTSRGLVELIALPPPPAPTPRGTP